MRRAPATALLIDLGVLRRYDPAVAATVERRHSLDPGTIAATAMRREHLVPAVLGRHTRAQWRAAVAEALAGAVGGAGAAHAMLAEWDAHRGAVVPAARDLVAQVRRGGRRVALVANATDELADDLARLGLADAFDAVVNSADLGVATPAPDFFAAACAALDVRARECLFVGDDARHVRGARACGLAALRWSGTPADARYVQAALGLAAG
ncbi:MAG TPA: HAD family hydrolase [Pilimelia sp.]|nr:HAD family hydrolase [Pilimelia sp.]